MRCGPLTRSCDRAPRPAIAGPAVLLAFCLALLPGVAAPSPEEYERYFRLAEQAKARGDFAAMEASLIRAFECGPGNEYAWRSLAWAQMLQGKWRESLRTARENIRRNGATGWSLKQLFESAVDASEYALAARTLERWSRLPDHLRNVQPDDALKLLQRRAGIKTYELEWSLTPARLGGRGPCRLIIPKRRCSRQTFRCRVEGARSWRFVRDGDRDLIEVELDGDRPATLQGTLTLFPQRIPARRLFANAQRTCPPARRNFLGVIPMHGTLWDPNTPECRAAAEHLRSWSHAATAQRTLDWLGAHFRYQAEGARSDLVGTLKTGIGVCWHICNLFCSLLRANEVPCAVVHCTALPFGEPGTEWRNVEAGHGQAAVYLEGLGWVYVEPLDRHSMRHYENTVAYFAISPLNEKDDYGRYRSLQSPIERVKLVRVELPRSLRRLLPKWAMQPVPRRDARAGAAAPRG